MVRRHGPADGVDGPRSIRPVRTVIEVVANPTATHLRFRVPGPRHS